VESGIPVAIVHRAERRFNGGSLNKRRSQVSRWDGLKGAVDL